MCLDDVQNQISLKYNVKLRWKKEKNKTQAVEPLETCKASLNEVCEIKSGNKIGRSEILILCCHSERAKSFGNVALKSRAILVWGLISGAL